jgi:hypothetical protein
VGSCFPAPPRSKSRVEHPCLYRDWSDRCECEARLADEPSSLTGLTSKVYHRLWATPMRLDVADDCLRKFTTVGSRPGS